MSQYGYTVARAHPLPEDLNMRVIDLYHIYGEILETKVVALKGVSLELRKKEILGLIGPSGAGKSTLLLALGGMLKPTAGRIILPDGTDITKLPEEALFLFRRRNIGYVFQEQNLLPHLTAQQNVEMPMRLINIPLAQRKKRAKELMERLGVWHRRSHTPKRLSGGEQQRVAICRALANNPIIVLADEPTGSVDAETSEQILELFVELKEEFGNSFLICSHDPIVAKYATRALEIRDGIIIGEHGKGIDFSQLDSSRFLVMDNQNRIAFPDNLVKELGGSMLFTWELKEDGVLLKPLKAMMGEVEKYEYCPVCNHKLAPDAVFCPNCGAKLTQKRH
ncbi:MAG: ATP-binding cassette domain-containing protein [Candidatus Heimdallarchaeaceae archaeon]